MLKKEKNIHLLLDLFMLNSAFLSGFFLRFGNLDKLGHSEYQLLFLLVNATWVVVFFASGYNFDNRRIKLSQIFFDFTRFWLLNLLITLAFVTIIKGHFYSRYFIMYDYMAFLFLGGMARLGFQMFLRRKRAQGFNYRRIIMVGVNDYSVSFIDELNNHPEYGYRFMGFFDTGNTSQKKQNSALKVNKLDDAFDYLIDEEIDEIFVSTLDYSDQLRSIITFCYLNNIKVNIINELINRLNNDPLTIQLDNSGLNSILTVKDDSVRHTVAKVLKRGFDIIGSLCVIIGFLSWAYPILALLIKLESRGPVLFIQRRSGLNNHSFNCWKFRSMVVNQGSDHKQAEKNDARITNIGRFLRMTNLDEFPQFFNVLKGDMSIVGPRPHMLAHTDYYSERIQTYMERHWMKPGITGLAQAKGFRGETRELRQMENRVEQDRIYVYHRSLGLDLRIIGMTAWNMLTFQKSGA